MTVASTTSPSWTGIASRSTVVVPSSATSSIRIVAVVVDHDGLLAGPEVVGGHVGDVRPAVRAPGAHRVGVGAGVALDRLGRPAVGVALAEDRVDGAPLDRVVAGADALLVVAGRAVGVVRQVVALPLELGDHGLELGDGGRDVGQLDDVGLGSQSELAELRERVVEALLVGEPLGELGDDPPRERDVAGVDRDARLAGVRLDDRQEGVRREQRRLVGVGVDDGGQVAALGAPGGHPGDASQALRRQANRGSRPPRLTARAPAAARATSTSPSCPPGRPCRCRGRSRSGPCATGRAC